MLANTINSTSFSVRLARCKAMRAAFAPMLPTVSTAGSIHLRSLMPVRSTIHASLVSIKVERYSLVITVSGTWCPRPTILEWGIEAFFVAAKLRNCYLMSVSLRVQKFKALGVDWLDHKPRTLNPELQTFSASPAPSNYHLSDGQSVCAVGRCLPYVVLISPKS